MWGCKLCSMTRTPPPPNLPPPNLPPPVALSNEVFDPVLAHRDSGVRDGGAQPELNPTPRFARRHHIASFEPHHLGLAVVAAVGVDIGLRAGVNVVSTAIGLLGAAGLVAQHTTARPARLLLVIASGCALGLPLRASTWLLHLNVWTAVGAIVAAAALGPEPFGPFSPTALRRTAVRMGSIPWGGTVLRASVRSVDDSTAARTASILRGLMLAIVPIAVLGGLLVAADELFAALLLPDTDPVSVVSHVLVTIAALGLVAGLVVAASTTVTATDPDDERPPRVAATEMTVVLGSVALLFGVFCAVQLYAAVVDPTAALEARGLTAAQHARSGFFQLLWVAGLTAVLLSAVALATASTDGTRHRMVLTLSAVVSLLTCAVVIIAMIRLDQYTSAFGQTTLRWYCNAFAAMLGVGFALTSAALIAGRQRLLPLTIVVLVATVLGAVNLLNPEARVAEHNVSRDVGSVPLDADYLTRLSADAWPVLLEHEEQMVDALGVPARLDLRCARAARPAGYGLLGFNLSRARLDC